MSDEVGDTQRDNQFDLRRHGLGPAIQQQLSRSAPTCAAPDCTNPGGAFTSERGGLIYEFCSEGCRTKFESEPA